MHCEPVYRKYDLLTVLSFNLLTIQSRLSVAKTSSSFKHLGQRTPAHTLKLKRYVLYFCAPYDTMLAT